MVHSPHNIPRMNEVFRKKKKIAEEMGNSGELGRTRGPFDPDVTTLRTHIQGACCQCHANIRPSTPPSSQVPSLQSPCCGHIKPSRCEGDIPRQLTWGGLMWWGANVPFFVFFLGVRGVNSSTPNSGGDYIYPLEGFLSLKAGMNKSRI